jgi:hypothetical protein
MEPFYRSSVRLSESWAAVQLSVLRRHRTVKMIWQRWRMKVNTLLLYSRVTGTRFSWRRMQHIHARASGVLHVSYVKCYPTTYNQREFRGKFPVVRVSRRNAIVNTTGKVRNGALRDGEQTHQHRTLIKVEQKRNSAWKFVSQVPKTPCTRRSSITGDRANRYKITETSDLRSHTCTLTKATLSSKKSYFFNWCSGGDGVLLGLLGTTATNRPTVPDPGDYYDV